MDMLEIFALQSAICLSLFYGGYRLLLAKETFHRFKRLALVGLLVLSVLIPLMEFEIAHFCNCVNRYGAVFIRILYVVDNNCAVSLFNRNFHIHLSLCLFTHLCRVADWFG